jgi:pimeloyl-ACP methyl ester carboxylesterase
MHGFDSLEQAADAVSAYNPHRPRPKDIGGLMKNLRRHDDGRLYWHWDPAFFTFSDLIEPLAFRDRLYAICASISIPVLLVRGMRSNVVTDRGVAEFRLRLPQLRVFEVGGAGHMITGDRNELFNEGVLKFIEDGAASAA